MKIFGYQLPFTKIDDVSKKRPESANIRKNAIPYEQQIARIRQDIQKWRSAVQSAESIHFPSRFKLYQTYKDVVLDGHLSGVMQQRIYNAIGENWIVCDENGVENEEKTKLLKRDWFNKFLMYSMESKFYGYSLIQFGDIVDDVFTSVELVPRQYVRPEHHVVIQTPGSYSGTDYLENPYKNWTIGVGDPKDLGLLMKASPYAIWKKNTVGSWAEYAELFGAPLRIGKTDTRDEVTRKNMENMLRDMQSSTYGVFDLEDQIELVGGNTKDSYRVYQYMADFCNKEMSKLILGQTMTSDDGASRSQAEVHERVAEQIEYFDQLFIETVVNDQLFPMMNYHGFGLDGLKFKFFETDTLDLEQQSKVDLELLKYYNVDPEYIKNKYGTPVEQKEQIEPTESAQKFVNDQLKEIENLYK